MVCCHCDSVMVGVERGRRERTEIIVYIGGGAYEQDYEREGGREESTTDC